MEEPFAPRREPPRGWRAEARCQWIENDIHEPDDPAPIFCGRKTLPRQAWCAAHHRRVYLPLASDAAQREIARLILIAKNRAIGRDTVHYVDRDFDAGEKLGLPGPGRKRLNGAP